jgi:hypothetical protein
MVEVTQDAALALWLCGLTKGQHELLGRYTLAAEQRARIEGFNEGIEAAVAAVDEGIDCNGIIASDIARLAKPMKGPTDEA